MPSRQVHNAIAKLLGFDEKLSDEINRFIDLPYLWLGGKHRKYFHNPETGLALAVITKNPQALLIHQLHILLDKNVRKKRTKDILEKIVVPLLERKT